MPVDANILANMKPFSLADTMQAAEQTKYMRVRNELLGYEAETEKALAERREKKRQIEEMYAGMPARIQEYERLGMHEEAAQTKEALLNGKRQELAMFEIVAMGVDESNWNQHRQEALESGMMEPHEMPPDFSQEWINKWLGDLRGEMKNLELTYGEPPSEQYPEGRTMTQEAIQQDGNIISDVPPYESSTDRNARTGTGSDGKPWQVTSGDTGQIKSLAAEQFDTILDQDGNFVGLQGEDKRKALQLTERASEIYNAGQGQVPHGEAVAQAAREQGLQVKSTSNALVNDPAAIL